MLLFVNSVKKIMVPKIMEQNFLFLYRLDTRKKIINFHSSDWVNEISNFFEIIFVILTIQKYIR